jgi:HK97 family phage prohead protease
MAEHNWPGGPIGHTVSMREDNYGLNVEGQLYNDTEAGKRWFRAMQACAVASWSIGFTVAPDGIRTERLDSGTLEVVTKGSLAEISAVLRGANKGATTQSVSSN